MIISNKGKHNQQILFVDNIDEVYAGVDRSDLLVYSVFDSIYKRMQGRFWIPHKIVMTKDASNFKELPEEAQKIFTLNLQWQMFADTMNTSGLSSQLIPYANNLEMKRCLVMQMLEEQNHCYKKGTEVLTSKGFVNFEDLKDNDLVANYRKRGTITFSKPLAIINKKYKGKIYNFEMQNYKQSVTPNHRVVMFGTRGFNNGKLIITEAENCSLSNYNLPVSGINQVSIKKLSSLEAIAIAYQAEGSLVNFHKLNYDKKNNRGWSYIFDLKCKYKIIRLLNLIEDSGIEYTTTRREDFSQICIFSPMKFDKEFSWVNVEKVNEVWGSEFLNELKYWGDSFREKGSVLYANTNIKAINIVQSIASVSGWQSGFYVYGMENIKDTLIPSSKLAKNLNQYYQVRLVPNKKFKNGREVIRTEEHYEGSVHCCTVESGMLVLRNEGGVFISGNSQSYNHIVSHMYNEPAEINDGILSDKRIMERASNFNKLYDSYVEIEIKLLMILAMEAISFVSSFLVTLGINEKFDNKITNTADQILLIAADEAGHVALFSNIIRISVKQKPDYDWQGKAEIIFKDVYQYEMAWRYTLEKIYPLPQLSVNNFSAFLKRKINNAMKGCGLKPMYEEVEFSYLTNWYSNVSNININNSALQETNSISYNKEILIKDWYIN